MLGIAAFDDVAGIIIYTIAIAFSSSMIGDSSLAIPHVLLELTKDIGGSVLVGVVLGFIFKYISKIFKKESDGSLIVIVIGIILLGYGGLAPVKSDKLNLRF
jgi:Kef-type K+ transport system membrane component KefB